MLSEIVKLALKAIFINKLRAFLTMLGVIIGVASVVSLSAIGTGVQQYISGQFDSLGANTIYLIPGGSTQSDKKEQNLQALLGGASSISFKTEDLRAVNKIRTYVQSATPFVVVPAQLSYQLHNVDTSIIGTTPNISTSLNILPEAGIVFNNSDLESKRQVIYLGYQLAQDLFGNINPVGKKIKVGERTFLVVGYSQKKGGGLGGPPFDNWAYVPYTTAFELSGSQKIDQIIIKLQSTDQFPSAKRAISQAIVDLGRLKKSDFSLLDQQQILDTVNQILNILTLGLSGIAAISLIVGGIGIMNIMLVTVKERTREIGLRKALGATPRNILLQFLFEALFLSVAGGIIGLILAQVLVFFLNKFFPAVITLQAILLAFGVSLLVGLIFGVAPARKAASLSPIEALRYE